MTPVERSSAAAIAGFAISQPLRDVCRRLIAGWPGRRRRSV
jgi:hypothetical protein